MANDALQLQGDKLIIKDGGVVLDPACCCVAALCEDLPFQVSDVENCLDLTNSGLGPTFTLAEFEAYLAGITIEATIPEDFWADDATGCLAPDDRCIDFDGWKVILSFTSLIGSTILYSYTDPAHPIECTHLHIKTAELRIVCSQTAESCVNLGNWTYTSFNEFNVVSVDYKKANAGKIDLANPGLSLPHDFTTNSTVCNATGANNEGPMVFSTPP